MLQEPSNVELALGCGWAPAEWRDLHVVLAVSGGADSVAMLRAMASLKEREGGAGRLYVAHLNHGLRGADADADQAWLSSLCDRLNLPLEVGRADVSAMASEHGDGWEAAARLARYEFLLGVAERLGARWVATAHTADDQVETVLHRAIRGSGLAGLAGIPRVRPFSATVTLVRPLLAVWRRDVLFYLESLGQDYRTDCTNSDPKYTRNRLRNELLPQLRAQFNADVDSALLRLAYLAGEAQEAIGVIVAPLARECVSIIDEGSRGKSVASRIQIECQILRGESDLIVREVCKSAWSNAAWPMQAMGFDEWQKLADMVAGDAALSASVLPGGVRALRDGSLLVLQRQTT